MAVAASSDKEKQEYTVGLKYFLLCKYPGIGKQIKTYRSLSTSRSKTVIIVIYIYIYIRCSTVQPRVPSQSLKAVLPKPMSSKPLIRRLVQ